MEYRLSYQSKWNDEGTHYNQTINAKLDREDFELLNECIACSKQNAPSYHDYKLYLHTFKEGVNYTNLTQAKYFAEYFFIINNDMRYKTNRNTIVIINIVE